MHTETVRTLTIALLLACQTNCGIVVALQRGTAENAARIDSRQVTESSGLAASIQNSGVFWTHNDSGDIPRLFAVTAVGDLLAEFHIQNAEAVDWEAVAIDNRNTLFVADTGNNLDSREDLAIYVITEPQLEIHPNDIHQSASRSKSISAIRRLPFQYPQGATFDAEALFWARGHLFLLTKGHGDSITHLFRFPSLENSQKQTLIPVGSFLLDAEHGLLGGFVTGADATANGDLLAVLTYSTIYIFKRPSHRDNYLSQKVGHLELSGPIHGQVEGIAWNGNALLLTNEAGELFHVDAPLTSRSFQHHSRRSP